MQQATLQIEYPGILTFPQDKGRLDGLCQGFSPNQPMDYFSYAVGDLFLNHNQGLVALEMMLRGPRLVCIQGSCVLLVTGAPMPSFINGKKQNVYGLLVLNQGDRLEFGMVEKGCRSYLHALGGFLVPKTLGSSSFHSTNRIGGFNGAGLPDDHRIQIGKSSSPSVFQGTLPTELFEWLFEDSSIQVLEGVDMETFPESNRFDLVEQAYTLSSESNRVGFRLQAPIKLAPSRTEKISEPVGMGTMQIPHSGDPIIMMSEHQTIGGYAVLAKVTSVSLPKLAQKKPGETITFEWMHPILAVKQYKARWAAMFERISGLH